MRDAWCVRTTLDLEQDVLEAAKELARLRGLTAGQMVSALVRQALSGGGGGTVRNSVPVLPGRPPGGARPTMKRVNELRDDA